MTPITLLPGLACDAEAWRDQVAPLSASRPVRVADQHARYATLPQMAAALLAETSGDLLLCGTSMGGMLALEVVRQAPQRVKALALLATSARPDTPELIQLRSEAIEMFADGAMGVVLQANAHFAFHPKHVQRLVSPYLAMMERAGAGQLIAQNRAIMARPDSRPLLPGIHCPTLVVCGEDDRLTPPEHSREIAAAIPAARLELLDECGHMIGWEQPERISALLAGWLSGL